MCTDRCVWYCRWRNARKVLIRLIKCLFDVGFILHFFASAFQAIESHAKAQIKLMHCSGISKHYAILAVVMSTAVLRKHWRKVDRQSWWVWAGKGIVEVMVRRDGFVCITDIIFCIKGGGDGSTVVWIFSFCQEKIVVLSLTAKRFYHLDATSIAGASCCCAWFSFFAELQRWGHGTFMEMYWQLASWRSK